MELSRNEIMTLQSGLKSLNASPGRTLQESAVIIGLHEKLAKELQPVPVPVEDQEEKPKKKDR